MDGSSTFSTPVQRQPGVDCLCLQPDDQLRRLGYSTVMVLTRPAKAARASPRTAATGVSLRTAASYQKSGRALSPLSIGSPRLLALRSTAQSISSAVLRPATGLHSPAGDLVQYTSSAWVRFAPLEGWRVWVSDEDLGYTYDGSSWLSDSASDPKAGMSKRQTQAEVEAETADKYPDAESVKYSPGVAKFWVCITYSAGTPSVAASTNVTGIVDSGTGYLTVTIATMIFQAAWVPFALGQGSNGRFVSVAPAALRHGSHHSRKRRWFIGRPSIHCLSAGLEITHDNFLKIETPVPRPSDIISVRTMTTDCCFC